MASQPKRCKYLYDTSEAVPRRTNYRLQLREENLSRGHQQDAAASAKRADDGVGAEVLELSFSDSDSETEGADVPANIGVPESPRGSIADPESSDFTDSEDEDEEHTDAETSQNVSLLDECDLVRPSREAGPEPLHLTFIYPTPPKSRMRAQLMCPAEFAHLQNKNR